MRLSFITNKIDTPGISFDMVGCNDRCWDSIAYQSDAEGQAHCLSRHAEIKGSSVLLLLVLV